MARKKFHCSTNLMAKKKTIVEYKSYEIETQYYKDVDKEVIKLNNLVLSRIDSYVKKIVDFIQRMQNSEFYPNTISRCSRKEIYYPHELSPYYDELISLKVIDLLEPKNMAVYICSDSGYINLFQGIAPDICYISCLKHQHNPKFKVKSTHIFYYNLNETFTFEDAEHFPKIEPLIFMICHKL